MDEFSPSEKQFLSDVGTRIRQLRIQKGLELEVLAVKVSSTPEWIREVESGETDMTLNGLIALAWALGTSPSNLVDINAALL